MILGLLVFLAGAINVLIGMWFIRWKEPHLPRAEPRESSPPLRARIEVTLGAVMMVLGFGIVAGTWPR